MSLIAARPVIQRARTDITELEKNLQSSDDSDLSHSVVEFQPISRPNAILMMSARRRYCMRGNPDQADRPGRLYSQASVSIAKYNDARRTSSASSAFFVAKKALRETARKRCNRTLQENLKENLNERAARKYCKCRKKMLNVFQSSQSSIEHERACHRCVNNLSESR